MEDHTNFSQSNLSGRRCATCLSRLEGDATKCPFCGRENIRDNPAIDKVKILIYRPDRDSLSSGTISGRRCATCLSRLEGDTTKCPFCARENSLSNEPAIANVKVLQGEWPPRVIPSGPVAGNGSEAKRRTILIPFLIVAGMLIIVAVTLWAGFRDGFKAPVTPTIPAPTVTPITLSPTVTPITLSPTVTPITPAPTVTLITPAPTVTLITPAPTIIPTMIITATQKPTITLTSESPCENSASFVADITIPDYTQLAPNQPFTKTWRIRNDGSCTWGPGYTIIFWDGYDLGEEYATKLGEDSTFPGETRDVTFPMVSPASPNTYKGIWRVVDQDGNEFGEKLIVIVKVVEQ